MKRVKIVLECQICGAHNYRTSVASQHQERFHIKKYCAHCKRQTLHQETR